MKLTKKMYKVMADLECLIGSECYNPNSYDGWNDIDGCDFRYPINVPDKDGEYEKIRTNIYDSLLIDNKNLTADSFLYMKYKFGSNELYIGQGIKSVLEYLENRYELDFNELEKNRKK